VASRPLRHRQNENLNGEEVVMAVLVRIIAGVLLIAHGLVHLLYFIPAADDPKYPFHLASSWIPEGARRPVAIFLVAAAVFMFGLLALAIWGVPGLSAAWSVLALVAAAMSLAVLVVFWDSRLFIGVTIDAAVIAVALVRPEWMNAVGR
jgi:hypothetical protein